MICTLLFCCYFLPGYFYYISQKSKKKYLCYGAVMGHLAGDKISDSHTTVIEAAEALVRAAHKDPRVKKIVLGRIDNTAGTAGGNQNRVKFIDEKACLLLSVTGSGSHQEIRVYIEDITENRQLVTKRLLVTAEDGNYAVDTLDRRS